MMKMHILAVACCVAGTLACDSREPEDGMTSRALRAPDASGDAEDAGRPDPTTCGNGRVAWNEECDPAAPGWEQACDSTCRRSEYQPCERTEQCPGLNALCAAYGKPPGSMFCAEYCETDAACPGLPGFQSVCNFAWCAVRCNAGACPNGMICNRDQPILDRNGKSRGMADICVVLSDR